MKPAADLFPETLLVNLDQGRIFTTSRKVAVHFKKRHDNVLRDIEALLAEISLLKFEEPNTIGRLNFEPSTYTDSRGKTYPEYHLSHDGFSLLAMGFTGKEALVWKLNFLAAFNAMESQLSAQRDRYVGALDILCPPLRPTVERTQSAQDRVSIASVIGKSCASVTYYRGKARRLGLLSL